MMNIHHQDRQEEQPHPVILSAAKNLKSGAGPVILSAAKNLSVLRQRFFAALRMTGPADATNNGPIHLFKLII